MATGHHGLVCQGSDSHAGDSEFWFELVTGRDGKLESAGKFLYVNDTMMRCYETAKRREIKVVDFRHIGAPGLSDEILITMDVGDGKWTHEQCLNVEFARIPSATYRLLFRFDGTVFHPSESTAKVLPMIEAWSR